MKRVISLLLVLGMMAFVFVSADARIVSVQEKELPEVEAKDPVPEEIEEKEAVALAEDSEAVAESAPEPEKEEDTKADENTFDDADIIRNESPAPAAPAEVTEAQPQPAPQAQPQPAPAQQPQAVQQADLPQAASILFIGDSRCVQMRDAVGGGGCSWICENSKGYDWLESKAIGQADRIIGKGTKVVVCLGVNDTEHVQKYAALINQKAAEWAARGAKTYYVSVNPVSTNPYRTEEEVQSFNATMPGLLSGVAWIDTHSVLVSNGYKLVDGLHFNEEGSIYIFNLIISSLH